MKRGSACTGVFTEQILCHHGVLLSVCTYILPVANEEAHVFQKGSPLLETRVVGTCNRASFQSMSWSQLCRHTGRSSAAK
jgi:hypothetical protein